MRLPIPRRLLAVGAAAAAAIALAPAPAHAAGYFGAQFDDLTIGANGAPGKAYPLYIYGEDVTGGKVVLDLTALDGIAKVSFPGPDGEKCTVAGKAGTCTFPDGAIGGIIPVLLQPLAGAVEGTTVEVPVTTTAADHDAYTFNTKVTVKSGADLIVLDQGEYDQKVKIGDDVSLPMVVGNVGDKTAPALAFTFSLTHGITPVEYEECEYAVWDEAQGTHVYCTVPIEDGLAPGQAVEIEGGFQGRIAADTSKFERGSSSVDVGGDIPAQARTRMGFAERGSGKHLKLVPATMPSQRNSRVAEIDVQDNWADSSWLIDTPFDLAAIGANLSGSTGDVVTAKLGVKNAGPSSANSVSSGEPILMFGVTVPAWAKLVGVPKQCEAIEQVGDQQEGRGSKPGYQYYHCRNYSYFFGAGETYTLDFRFELTGDSGADGLSTLTPIGRSEPWSDANNANNDAKITRDGGTGGGLPVTGVQVGLIAGVGSALVALGVVLFMMARRRRMPVELS
ncbi:hypothetical protein [Catellatospora methionotrophica]|uniref:hypothetical protein n=1 Tax=Catellatospora methionotrophica TaxID=121620 RepID=UPI00340A56D9